jgi:hypothetical protein
MEIGSNVQLKNYPEVFGTVYLILHRMVYFICLKETNEIFVTYFPDQELISTKRRSPSNSISIKDWIRCIYLYFTHYFKETDEFAIVTEALDILNRCQNIHDYSITPSFLLRINNQKVAQGQEAIRYYFSQLTLV